jgi:EF-hand domain-containing protein 1
VNQPGLSFIGDNYLTCDEIVPGQPIVAFNRAYQINGVDEFTREFFLNKYGREFMPGSIRMPEAPEPTERQIPPYNGFGNEVDSLGYIYDLIPKKPKGDFFKSVDNDKKILRYTARFNTRVPEDVDRRFIISFYLADDAISIYEPAVKNSGIIEGPFLRRNKYKNVDKNNEFITPTDLPIGGDIKINGFSYHILSCDEYTVKYLQQHLD